MFTGAGQTLRLDVEVRQVVWFELDAGITASQKPEGQRRVFQYLLPGAGS